MIVSLLSGSALPLLVQVGRAVREATQQQAPPITPSGVLGMFWLAGFVMFAVSFICVGFVAKRINNIAEASYGKAFLATFLKGLGTLVGLAVFLFYLKAPPIFALTMAYSIIPIAVYKVVFSSMWSEAALIWLVALFIEGVAGVALIMAGLLTLAPFLNAA